MQIAESRFGTAASFANFQDGIALLGRVFVAFLFLPAGVGKLMNFTATTAYIASAGLPLPVLGAAIAILIEVGFSMALLLGYRVRWVALGMALFTLAAAVFFHDFWALPEVQKVLMKTQFAKNMAIAGGLLAFCAFGGGRLSLDHRMATNAVSRNDRLDAG
jgi:putative oxidoreductase